jgi:hypothetical protein
MAKDAPQYIEIIDRIGNSHHFVRISQKVRQRCKAFFEDYIL